ncbi:MAG: hypothetical protein IT223_08970, partial [Crocinitomicaceae bacterium]|nr:hypothetical protein [Crocinitomicaceae bacterium]
MKQILQQLRWKIIAAGTLLLIVLSAGYSYNPTPAPYHSEDDLVKLLLLNNTLPVGDNEIFIGSGKCGGCHGLDPVEFANITEEGEEVSPAENWRATMMANSAKDPFWQAKMAHEIAINPQHTQELVNKCTACHAPVGRFTSLMNGEPDYSIAAMLEDSLAMDGVTCGACHQQRINNLGNHFSGTLTFHSDTIWGPYISEEMDFPIFSAAMNNFVGYEPLGNHIVSQSEMCATCHSLITETVDLNGNFTGETFVEQATYHEWLNSSFNEDESLQKECQGCHMPALDESIIIASGYSFLPRREPFAQHWFIGGNSFMLELMKNRIDELGITATTDHFDTVIQRTLYQLQNETANVEIEQNEVDGDTARYTVRLTNLAGHKFPSGYPSRRAYIEFIASDSNGNEIFHSGKLNNMYEVVGNDPQMEPHYDLINSEDEVQIYEMVMADTEGNITTVLERADHLLKDNRLVPLGFSTLHNAYDTTKIVGSAAGDPNFNHIDGIEGTANDEVRFHIPLHGFDGEMNVTAKLMYQSVPPKWNFDMFTVDNPTINAFEEMYWAEGADPVMVGSAAISTMITGINEKEQRYIIKSNPSTDGSIVIESGSE